MPERKSPQISLPHKTYVNLHPVYLHLNSGVYTEEHNICENLFVMSEINPNDITGSTSEPGQTIPVRYNVIQVVPAAGEVAGKADNSESEKSKVFNKYINQTREKLIASAKYLAAMIVKKY